jgi:hypothetical protein
MIRALLSCLCLVVMAASAEAQRLPDGDRLWLSVTIEPDSIVEKGAYVGGEMVLRIRLMSPDSFQRLRLDWPDIEGARTEMLIRPHIRQLSSLGSMGYSDQAGYSYEARLSIIPQRSGTLIIPPIGVTGLSKPEDGNIVEFRRQSLQQAITVHPISPSFDGDHWIVSRDVTFQDYWSPAPVSIKSGDTVQRRVVLSIAGVTADDLPELTLLPASGFGVLSKGVSTKTEITDEGLIAHLEQQWDIYVDTEEVIHIDGFRVPYWNPELARTEMAGLPRQRIEPLPKDALALRDQWREEALAEHRRRSLGLIFLLSMPGAALVAFLAFIGWHALPTRADLSLWRASGNSATSLSFYRSFLSWSRSTLGTRNVADRRQTEPLGTRAAASIDGLHRSIFGKHRSNIDGRRTASALIRASRRQRVKRSASAVKSALSSFLFLR